MHFLPFLLNSVNIILAWGSSPLLRHSFTPHKSARKFCAENLLLGIHDGCSLALWSLKVSRAGENPAMLA